MRSPGVKRFRQCCSRLSGRVWVQKMFEKVSGFLGFRVRLRRFNVSVQEFFWPFPDEFWRRLMCTTEGEEGTFGCASYKIKLNLKP